MFPPAILLPVLALLRLSVRGVMGPLGFWRRRAPSPSPEALALLARNWVEKQLQMIEALRVRLAADALAPPPLEPAPDAIPASKETPQPPTRPGPQRRRRNTPVIAEPDPEMAANRTDPPPSRPRTGPRTCSRVQGRGVATTSPVASAKTGTASCPPPQKSVWRKLETRAHFITIS